MSGAEPQRERGAWELTFGAPVGRGGEPVDDASDDASDWEYRWNLGGRRLWRPSRRRLARIAVLAVGDVVAVAAALFLVLGIADPSSVLGRWLLLAPLTVVLTLAGQGAARTYGAGRARREYGTAALAAVLTVVALAVLGAAYPPFRLEWIAYLLLAASLGGFVAAVRWGAASALRWCHARGILRRSVLLVAREGEGRRMERWLERHGYDGLEVSDVFRIRRPPANVEPGEGPPLAELGEWIEALDSRIVLVPRDLPEGTFRAVAYQCFLHGAQLRVARISTTELPFLVVDQDEHGVARVELAVPRLQLAEMLAKRALDLSLATVGLLVLAPVYAAIAAAVRLDSRGPVLFRQERLGRGGKRFRLLKFRSMHADAEDRLREDDELYRRYLEHDYKLPVEQDPRVTRVGGFLRRTSLDELPQLLNVLKGDMSLVGPRPVVPPEIEEYGTHAPVLLGVKPGVTGYWQIAGRSSVGYPERARREIEYVENWSLWLDLVILVRTVPVVLRRIGVV